MKSPALAIRANYDKQKVNQPVKRYRESIVNAASQTQRCVSLRSSRSSDQSVVRHTFAEQSPDVVTNMLGENSPYNQSC